MLKREPPVWHWCKPKPCSTSSLCPRGTQIWSYVSRKWIRMLRIGINIHRETPTHALNLLVIVVAEAKLKQPVQWVVGEVDEGAAGCHHDSRADPSFSKSCRKQLKNQPPQNSCNFWSLFKSSAAAVRLFCIDRPRADETKIQGSSLKAVYYYGVTTPPPAPSYFFQTLSVFVPQGSPGGGGWHGSGRAVFTRFVLFLGPAPLVGKSVPQYQGSFVPIWLLANKDREEWPMIMEMYKIECAGPFKEGRATSVLQNLSKEGWVVSTAKSLALVPLRNFFIKKKFFLDDGFPKGNFI